MQRRMTACGLSVGICIAWLGSARSIEAAGPDVRGLATRAPAGMKIDGDLSEFADAFCTPIEYFNPDLKNRPAQFFYMWDDEAFYAGLRTLDEPDKQANPAKDNQLWLGDAVEWYFDTRRDAAFRSRDWGPGAVHCYWTGFKGKEIEPRFCLRPGYLDAIPKIGVEVGARRTEYGMEVEFKLPWANFPNFKPAVGEIIALDAELCYSDGGARVDRSFAYGSPLSVTQPASQAPIQLVDKIEAAHWKPCGPVMMPIRVDVPWGQPDTVAHAQAGIALPPNQLDQVGKVVFRLTSLEGEMLGEFEAKPEAINANGAFHRAMAQWPVDIAPPGRHHVTAVVFDQQGKELTRIAPRLVSVGMKQGY